MELFYQENPIVVVVLDLLNKYNEHYIPTARLIQFYCVLRIYCTVGSWLCSISGYGFPEHYYMYIIIITQLMYSFGSIMIQELKVERASSSSKLIKMAPWPLLCAINSV
jgi:hypothetical protein